MYGLLLYLTLIFGLQFLFLTDPVYRKTVFYIALISAVAAFFFRSRWVNRLKKRYTQAGILVTDKNFKDVLIDSVWLVLELYFMVFLYLIPGFTKAMWGGGNLVYSAVIVILAVVTLCDIELDVVLTGEKRTPAFYVRYLPVSMLASAAALIYGIWFRKTEGTVGAFYLLLLFLVELVINLGIRTLAQKRNGCADISFRAENGRKLRRKADTVIWLVLLEIYPLRPLYSGKRLEPGGVVVLGIIFVLQSICLFLYLYYKPAWLSYMRRRAEHIKWQSENLMEEVETAAETWTFLCWLIFGNILPVLLLPGYEEAGTVILCTLLPVVILWCSCLSGPIYMVLTGAEELPPVWRRVPYLTLAAWTYAVMAVSMPWTNAVLPAALAGLAILELALKLGVQRLRTGYKRAV